MARPATFYDEQAVGLVWVEYDLTVWERVCGIVISNDANPTINPGSHLFVSFDHGDGMAFRLKAGESMTWDYGFGEGVHLINVRSNVTALPKRIHAWGQR